MAAKPQSALDAAALTELERRIVERFVSELRDELGEDLRAVWLYGSRARGDAILDDANPDRKSDVDLMVLAEGGRARHGQKAFDLAYAIAKAEGDSPVWYSVFVADPDWLRGRRQIRSFFVQEVDRDKIVLTGSALA